MAREVSDPLFPYPTPQQRDALATASTYLQRAAAQAATRMMGKSDPATPRVIVINELSEGMLRSAALCQMLIDLFDGWPPETE